MHCSADAVTTVNASPEVTTRTHSLSKKLFADCRKLGPINGKSLNVPKKKSPNEFGDLRDQQKNT
jgi:hypothetical protein